MAIKRIYFLGSVRAFAMYLGVVLHAAVPFMPWYGDFEIKEGYRILL